MSKSKKGTTRLPGEQTIFGPGRGGSREGAGRPTKGHQPRVAKTLMLDAVWTAEIERVAKRDGVSQSDVANALLWDLMRGTRTHSLAYLIDTAPV